MDVMVRPVTSSSDAVNVSFSLTVWALVDLVCRFLTFDMLTILPASDPRPIVSADLFCLFLSAC